MVTSFVKVLVAGVEFVALVLFAGAFLVAPDSVKRFLAVFGVPLAFLFVFTLLDALLR